MTGEGFTGHSEGHQGCYLPLQAVGGDAGVVAGVAASDFGEAELAVPLIHVRRQLSSVCGGGGGLIKTNETIHLSHYVC